MIAAVPAERVAEILVGAGYRRMDLPLRVSGLDFDVAGAFIGGVHSADLVVIGDMAAHGERKVLQQIEGIARALDVMRSHRPLTIVVVGPRPVGRTLEALARVGRILPVEEAVDPAELRDRLAILLPLELPEMFSADRELGAGEELTLPPHPLASELVEASKLGETAVRDRLHEALRAVLSDPIDDEKDKSETKT